VGRPILRWMDGVLLEYCQLIRHWNYGGHVAIRVYNTVAYTFHTEGHF
jgi:hypothetical protein